MLAYVYINLLSIINQFSNIAVRNTTNSFYFNAEHNHIVEAFARNIGEWGSWIIQQETLHEYCESADVTIDDNYHGNTIT
jgi:hypothetical protein